MNGVENAVLEERIGRVARDFTRRTGVPVDVHRELTARAREAGFPPAGRTSANGTCRLLPAADGWVALNLARADDRAALPALLGLLGQAPETAVEEAVRTLPVGEFTEATRLLSIPAAALGGARDARLPVLTRSIGEPVVRGLRPLRGLRVVDFSALWAGPLCARLLGLAGARVLQVESRTRPDGARHGPADFHRRLHQGLERRTVDFTPATIGALTAEADVVIESSRPRALRRLGLHAEEFLTARPGRVWVGITGHGREDDRVAFGDDAAVAGGLVGPGPVFLYDAVADPVTGLYAAGAAASAVAGGGGILLDVAMSACAADLAR